MLGLKLPTDPRWVNIVEKNIEAQSRIASLHPELQDEMFPPEYRNRIHAIEEKKKKFQLIKSMKTVLNKFSSN